MKNKQNDNHRHWLKAYGVLGHITVALVLAQLLLVMVSWIITAAWPELRLRSLLSGEGIRWFFGSFTANMSTPLLVWIIVGAVAWGAIVDSRLTAAVRAKLRHEHLPYRQRIALKVVATEVVIAAIVIVVLTCVPHAILLSATGGLWPSSFSEGLIPTVAFIGTGCGVSYALASGEVKGMAAFFALLSSGMRRWAWIFAVYIVAAELYASVMFVFAL